MVVRSQIPIFDVEAIGDQVASFYMSYSYLETLYAILGATDWMLQKLPMELDGVPEDVATSWEDDFERFRDRYRWYVEASEAGEGPDEVEALVGPPFFDGEYDEGDFESPPSWPDIQTLWRLLNRLIKSGDTASDLSHASAGELQELVSDYWQKIASNLTDELAGGEDVDAEAEKAIEEAKTIAEGEHPEEVVSEVSADAAVDDGDDDAEDGSMAPLLLGVGVFLLMASKRRR